MAAVSVKRSIGQRSNKFAHTYRLVHVNCHSFKSRMFLLQTHRHWASSVVSYTAIFVSIFIQCKDKKNKELRRRQPPPYLSSCSRWITFLFFSYWDLKVSGKFDFSLHHVCWSRMRSCWWSAWLIANQNKTLQHDFSSVIYISIY